MTAWTVQKIAKDLDVSDSTVMQWIHKGKLKAYALPGAKTQPIWRVAASEYQRFLETNTRRCNTTDVGVTK